MDTTMLERIAGGNVRAGQKAKLEEHCVLRQANEPFPYLVKSAGAAATGLYFDALTPMQMLRLDAYETPFGYFREDVTLEVDGQSKQGFAYFPDPTVKASDALWDMNEWDASHGDLSREMADEIGSYTPPLSGDALIQQWAACFFDGSQTIEEVAKLPVVPHNDSVVHLLLLVTGNP